MHKKNKAMVLFTLLGLLTNFAISGPKLQLPPNTEGLLGGTVEIPVTIVDGAGIAGFQFKMTYDSNILEFINVTSDGLTQKTWLIAGTVSEKGNVSAIGADLTAQGLQVSSGTICKINFKVIGAPGQITSLQFATLKVVNVQGEEVPSQSQGGSVQVKAVTSFGSISGNVIYQGSQTGKILVALFSSRDLSSEPIKTKELGKKAGTYNFALSDITPGKYYLFACMDVNGNNKFDPLIDPFGAYTSNPITLVEGQSITNANITIADPPQIREIKIENSQGVPGKESSVLIKIDNAIGVGFYEFKILWDESLLELIRCEKGSLLNDDWGVSWEKIQTGGMRIAASSPKSYLYGSCYIANLIFKVKDNAQVGKTSNLDFDTNNSYLTAKDGTILNAKFINGKFEIVTQFVYHPADVNKDGKLVLAEVISYATAWKKGEQWPEEPVVIPMAYMVRAAYLWKRGENYDYDPTQPPPACWIPKSF